jgi:ATP-dependent DNA ligase
MSRRHQHITSALTTVPAERFGLDGELVVLDDDGRSNAREKNLSLLKQTQEEPNRSELSRGRYC